MANRIFAGSALYFCAAQKEQINPYFTAQLVPFFVKLLKFVILSMI